MTNFKVGDRVEIHATGVVVTVEGDRFVDVNWDAVGRANTFFKKDAEKLLTLIRKTGPEQFAALKIGARFTYGAVPMKPRIKVSEDKFYSPELDDLFLASANIMEGYDIEEVTE